MSAQSRSTFVIYFALGVLTLGLYWPLLHHEFITFDDNDYILDNPAVKAGLSFPGFVWAFKTSHSGNWHPLTWLSHQLDCTLYGLNPAGHHLTNLLLHVADTLLLFCWLRQLTGTKWRSAVVAALFAWHPLNVESVAWASERKNVLSTLFAFLTLISYTGYAKESQANKNSIGRSRIYYVLALGCFALGLMCKPMLVTLPCVLLLLDFWPLGRLAKRASSGANLDQSGNLERTAPSVGALILEKIPFFFLTIASSVATYFVQKSGGSVSSVQMIGLDSRIANALVSYLHYLGKTVWPVDLAAIYPYVPDWPPGFVIGSALLLIAISSLFLWRAPRNPYLITGWLWFLGTLVPTIGLVQVGLQSFADRYMYLPGIGLFIAGVWGLAGWWETPRDKQMILFAAGTMALAGCLVATRIQLSYWQNGEVLFRHALAVTSNNYVACDALGVAIDQPARQAEAFAMFSECVRIESRYPDGQYNLAVHLLNQGRLDEAVAHLNTALASNPRFAPAHSALGKALMQQGKFTDAYFHLAEAVKLAPDNPNFHFNLGALLMAQSKLRDAAAEFAEVLAINPDYADAHMNLGIVLAEAGSAQDAIAEFRFALRLTPQNSLTHFNLGFALLQSGQPAEAAQRFLEALELSPDNPPTHFYLGQALVQIHKPAEAIAQFRSALRLKPDFALAMNGLAWVLCTAQDVTLRNAAEAVALAEQNCALTQSRGADSLLTLAAAYAEAGRFAEAAANAGKAKEIAAAARDKTMITRSEDLLRTFKSGRPYRDPP